jgi:hypothetical protein
VRSIVRGQRAVKRSIMLKGPPRIAPLMRMSTWKCESKKWATAAIRYVAAGHTIGETLHVCGLRAHRAHGTLTAHTGACARKPAKSAKKHFCTSVTLSKPRATWREKANKKYEMKSGNAQNYTCSPTSNFRRNAQHGACFLC